MSTETTSPGPLWVVTDQLPHPPRNGITLPLYHHCRQLLRQRPLRLLLLEDIARPADAAALAANEALFGPVMRVALRRRGAAARLLDELRGRAMYQHGWRLADEAVLGADTACDSLLVSPMSAVAKWQASGLAGRLHPRVRIAAVNDCTTAEYFHRGRGPGALASAKAWLDRRRCRFIAPIEARLLDDYEHVLLQTDVDRDLLTTLVSPRLAERVTLVPNGVIDSYFRLRPADPHRVLFVAELSGEYAATAHWLAAEVWPQVAGLHPRAEFTLVGRGASPALRALLTRTPHARHVEYVDDLAGLYAGALIALSPVFKGFGLINKTLEAMASGLPVIGGAAAFNGIPGFRSGEHGIACASRSTAEFVAALRSLLPDPARRALLGDAARRLVDGRFRWDTATQRLAGLLGPPAA